jgi:hypothetical protein
MSSDIPLQTPPAPSLSTLARTTAIVVAAAIVILITLVLPAEYAIDPLGTGRRLGLTDIASPPVAAEATAVADNAALVPVQRGPLGEYPSDFKVDVFEIPLAPYEYIEYKYRLEKGATMLFAWRATAPLIHDFHGERAADAGDGGPAEESYDKGNRRQARGSFTASFAGIHGWYWENPGGEPITIRLTSSGFYSSAVEIRSDRTRRTHDLKSLDAPPQPSTTTGAHP